MNPDDFPLNANGPAYTARQERHGVPLAYVGGKLGNAIELNSPDSLHVRWFVAPELLPSGSATFALRPLRRRFTPPLASAALPSHAKPSI